MLISQLKQKTNVLIWEKIIYVFIRLIDYVPNLGQYNFNNRASSCCFNGIWILYDEYNYNINNLQVQ